MTARKAALLTSLLWLTALGSCASSTTIKTWLIEKEGLRHKTSSVNETMTFLEANGYRCYSKADDQTWREELASYKSCCEQRGGLR